MSLFAAVSAVAVLVYLNLLKAGREWEGGSGRGVGGSGREGREGEGGSRHTD